MVEWRFTKLLGMLSLHCSTQNPASASIPSEPDLAGVQALRAVRCSRSWPLALCSEPKLTMSGCGDGGLPSPPGQ